MLKSKSLFRRRYALLLLMGGTPCKLLILKYLFHCLLVVESKGFMATENNIKNWLLPLLEDRGLSVEQLATQAGLTRSAIYYYFSDRCRPTNENMRRMCDVLGVSHEEGMRQFTPREPGRKPRRK